MGRLGALAWAGLVCVTAPLACKRSGHAHIPTYVAPSLPAGFTERAGAGWRIAAPSTWRPAAATGPAAVVLADPQLCDDYRANANVVTEPWSEGSYDYAKASELALRRDPRATVEAERDEVVDGDPTLFIESHWSAGSTSTGAYRTLQSALAARGVGYVVTCSVAPAAFERYRSTCESILRSFAVER